jgi:DNA-binding MarR family transcriptional regulator
MAAKHSRSARDAASPAGSSSQRLKAVASVVTGTEAGESARLLHDRVRLGIMSALSVNRSMSFAELKDLLGTTDGNLSKHARRLENAGFVSCSKHFSGRVPRTDFSLTAKGRRQFARHLEHLETLIRAARPG